MYGTAMSKIEHNLLAKSRHWTRSVYYLEKLDLVVHVSGTCPANTKHPELQLPKDSSVPVPQIQRLIPKERGSEK